MSEQGKPIWTAALLAASQRSLEVWAKAGDRLAQSELERRQGVGKL